MKTTILPKYIFENNVHVILGHLSDAEEHDEIVFDFQRVTYYIPVAITSIIATIKRWLLMQKKVTFINHTSNGAFQYLQRIDFFQILGLNYTEDFNRHAPLGSFVTIKEIGPDSRRKVNEIAEELVGAIIPQSKYADPYRLLQYALGEIILNCVQHSQGTGFIAAQYSEKYDLIRIGITDNGIGIRESFKVSNSPHFLESLDDRGHLDLALRPETSSKNHTAPLYGEPENAGVGLSIVQATSSATMGHFIVASGSAVYWKDGTHNGIHLPTSANHYFQGTVTAVAFKRKEVYEYAQLLKDAKISIGLLSKDDQLTPNIFQ